MISVARIALAVHLMAPALPNPVATEYARVVAVQARRHRLDPLLIVAIAAHESRFRASLRSSVNGELYVGLGQIRARNYAECSESYDTERCKQRIASLQAGAENLTHIAQVLDANRRFCTKRLHRRAKESEYLSLYQGYGIRPDVGYCLRSSRGKRTALPRLTVRVLKMRTCLYQETKRRKPRALYCFRTSR